MVDLVGQAGAALAPLMSAGAGGMAAKVAEGAGGGFVTAAGHIIQKLRGHLRSERPEASEIEEAIRVALDDGDLSRVELEAFVKLSSSQTQVTTNTTSKTTIFGHVGEGATIVEDTTVHVAGDWNIHGR